TRRRRLLLPGRLAANLDIRKTGIFEQLEIARPARDRLRHGLRAGFRGLRNVKSHIASMRFNGYQPDGPPNPRSQPSWPGWPRSPVGAIRPRIWTSIPIWVTPALKPASGPSRCEAEGCGRRSMPECNPDDGAPTWVPPSGMVRSLVKQAEF